MTPLRAPLPLALLAALLLTALGAAAASAGYPLAGAAAYDSTDGCQGSWQRRFGVDILVLDCAPGYASEHDVAYMYARGPVDTGADWRSQLNFLDAVWLFDAGARGKASLIIDFHHSGRAAVADFFDDVSGAGEVHFGLERGYPRSVSSRFPTMRVTAPDGWWVRDGKINYNLHLAVDGPVLASWNGQVFTDMVGLDGQADVVIDVHDPAGSGRPKWEIVQAQPPIADSSAIMRTSLMVNEADDELPVDTYIFWPHLGHIGGQPRPEQFPDRARSPLWVQPAGYGIDKHPGKTFPPIQVDWSKAKIQMVGEFVASRGRAHNWFVYSVLPFARGDLTTANFENPFAFYDLAGVDDGYPDLQIRDEYTAVGDPYAVSPIVGPFNEIRYSWDMRHERRWTYKLNLIGRRPMPATVTLGDGVSLKTVPYAEYPRWVTSYPWQAGDFYAVEKKAYWTSEGIYEHFCDCRNPYFFGQSADKPVGNPAWVPEGLRAEMAGDLGEAPRLYVSAVDRKLHLNRAESGFWRIDEHNGMKYAAVDSSIINRWERTVDGGVSQSLARVGDRIVYADAGGVRVARATGPETLFFAPPPADQGEYFSLRSQLDAVTPVGDGTDLDQLFDEFKEERVAMPGLVAWDLRPAGSGFRFVAAVPASVPGAPWGRDVPAGTYVVSYAPGAGFTIAPARPARIVLGQPKIQGEAPTEILPARLSVEVRNEGDEDAIAVPVVFMAGKRDLAREAVAWATVDLPAGQTRIAEATWSPPVGGDWKLHAAAIGREGPASETIAVAVGAAPPADVGSLLFAQGMSSIAGGAISASLTLVVAIAIGVGYAVWSGRAGRAARNP
ncbi:MAG TPA: hypothetical protein VGL23_23570 [Chloroflexota bacterium]